MGSKERIDYAYRKRPLPRKNLSCAALLVLSTILVLGNLMFASDDCQLALKVPFECTGGAKCRQQGGSCEVVARPPFGAFREIKCECVGCPDATIRATFRSDPIDSLPATRTFIPEGTWEIENLVSEGPITVAPEGSMTVSFERKENAEVIDATVTEVSLRVRGLPDGTVDVGLLPVSCFEPFIGVENTVTNQATLIPEASLILVNAENGSTDGVFGTLNSTPGGSFTFKSGIDGRIDFATGFWSWTAEGRQCPVEQPTATTPFARLKPGEKQPTAQTAGQR